VSASLLMAGGCTDGAPTTARLTPSAVIIPDGATVSVGAAQVFNVWYATVVRFDLASDRERWSQCVSVDSTFTEANAVRVVAHARCRGLVYISATIGDRRSPLVAVLKVE
jgi:hypothetical protein